VLVLVVFSVHLSHHNKRLLTDLLTVLTYLIIHDKFQDENLKEAES